jgi:hypothetical protein
MIWSFTHSISILCVMAWFPSFHRRSTKVHGAPPWLSSSITIYHLDIHIRHTGHLNVKTTIWLLPVVYNLQKGSSHTICNIKNLTISHHMPLQKQVRRFEFVLHILRGLGFSRKNHSYLRTRTTTVIKILLTTLCKIGHNYSGRNVHPQSHIYRSMSSVGQVSWTWSRKVILGQLQSHYATMIQNTKKNCNNMIIYAHIHMCSNRANQLRIEMALIQLMGS